VDISAYSFLLSVSLWIFSVVYPVALSLVFFLFFFLLGLVAFQDLRRPQICTQESEVCWFQFCLLLSNQRSEARPYKAREVGGIAEGMGKSSGTATTTNASWTFEIAPPHIITVERTSPKQRSLETILENISAMALWLETAPPELITVDRGYSTRASSTLDTIAEENMSTSMAAGGGGGHMLQQATSEAAAAAADVLRPLSSNWENTTNSRLAPGFVACN